jgi:hypothetical protein
MLTDADGCYSYTNAWIHTMLFNWPLRTRVLNYLSAKEVSLTYADVC